MKSEFWNTCLNNIKNFSGENFFVSDDNCEKKKQFIFFISGILLIILYYLPQFINVHTTVFRIHDYLEQDFVNIHLGAKYLFSPEILELKELFGGTFRGSIQSHGIFYILLYKVIQGPVFIVISKTIVALFGFSGMYLLFNKLYNFNKTVVFYVIAVFTAFFYSITPQLLHGLTCFLLPWIIVIAYDIIFDKKGNWLFLITFFAGIFSSFIYSGFMFCGIFFLLFFIFIFKHEYVKAVKSLTHCTIFLIENIITFAYTIISTSEISARKDWELSFFVNDFFKSIGRYLTIGDIEVSSIHHLLVYPILFLLILLLIISKRNHYENKILLCNIGSIVAISLIAAFWRSAAGMEFRESLGDFFKSFQLNRMTILLLSLQHILLFLLIILMCKYFISLFGNNKTSRLCLYVLLSMILMFAFSTSLYKEYGSNVQRLSFEDFFQTEMMREVGEYIGKPKESYHVASFGYNPGIALYNDFLCLDGYSTNYRLAYKNEWNKVISNEIKKDDYLKNYFNCWGGRVYLFSPSLNQKSSMIDLPDFNYEHLRKMGCDYIFSKYKFKTLPEILVLKKVFYSKNSNYKLFLYAFTETM